MAYQKDFIKVKDASLGKARINAPSRVVAGSEYMVTAEFIAGRRGLEKGSALRLELPYAGEKINVDKPGQAGYTEFSAPIKLKPFMTTHWKLAYCELEEDLPPGAGIRAVFNRNRTGRPQPVTPQVAGRDCQEIHFDVKPRGEEKFRRLVSARTRIVGGKARSFLVKAPTVAADGESFVVVVAAKDEFDNVAEGFRGAVELSASAGVSPARKMIGFEKKDRGKKAIRGFRFTGRRIPPSTRELLLKEQNFYFVLPPPPEMENVAVIDARTGDGEIKGRSNPVYRAERREKNRIYWGDIHVHTRDFSDGFGSGMDAYHYLREVSLLDFGGLGDHSFQGGHPAIQEIPERDLHISSSDWKRVIRLARKNGRAGKFVGIPGYEWSGRRMAAPKDWPYPVVSDKCVHFADYREDNPIVYQNSPDGNTPEKLYRRLRGTGALIVSHSTASAPMGTAWEAVKDRIEPVVEIYSMHGASEYLGNPRPLISLRREGHVHEALKKGLKLGFIAGGDDHYTHPGCRTEQRRFFQCTLCTKYRPGLTAVITDDFSLKGIINAIRRRHCYATTGERIWLDFRIGKAMMGEEITLRRPPLIEVAAAGTAELEKAEIVRNGETIFCRATSHDRMKFAFVDEKIKKGENYYYLRVTQVDGETAWSSPIWVNFRR